MTIVKASPGIFFFIAAVVLCGQIVSSSLANQKYKNDYAELNNIKYGLLSIDAWNRRVTAILIEEIRKLNLSKANKEELREHIEAVLSRLADAIDKQLRETNAATATGRMKQAVVDAFISLEDIKKGVPAYTDTVIEEMTKSDTVAEFKAVLIAKLKQYSSRTFDATTSLEIIRILRETGSSDLESARTGLQKNIADNHELIVRKTIILIMLCVSIFILLGSSTGPLSPSGYALLVVSLILLLIPGVTTPMIDMEAKIAHLEFVLMGHPVQFENQMLYFQSKSILDVFRILITNKDIQMQFVGVLLITFSIFFPLLKILSTLAYYYQYRGARENPLIRFFVLKSGKWSMADVMVVALFMTYVGFNGIIANQFDQLRTVGQQLDIITTNGTSLQPGYYLFLAYCLLSLFLSEFLIKKRGPAEQKSS
jgi:predicted fused transcriptional regulator/phosphomethylpyrimidine kinase